MKRTVKQITDAIAEHEAVYFKTGASSDRLRWLAALEELDDYWKDMAAARKEKR